MSRIDSLEKLTKLEALQLIRRQMNVQNVKASKANIATFEAKTEESYSTLLVSLYKEQFGVDLSAQLDVDAEIKREKEALEKELDEAKTRAKPLQNGA